MAKKTAPNDKARFALKTVATGLDLGSDLKPDHICVAGNGKPDKPLALLEVGESTRILYPIEGRSLECTMTRTA